jgi:dUTP diphosphatase|nr:MAG TPA: dUTPase [Herelleviridae sp.]
MNKGFDLLRMLKEQEDLDNEFQKKEGRPRDMTDGSNLLALLVEVGETVQEDKVDWNYWKNNCDFNKNKFLEEMSDVLHFFLTFIRLKGNIKDIEKKIDLFNVDTFYKALEDNTEESMFVNKPNLVFSFLNLFKFDYTDTEVINITTFEVFMKFVYITNIFQYLSITWEEFLEVHYKKFEKNLNERTKESY